MIGCHVMPIAPSVYLRYARVTKSKGLKAAQLVSRPKESENLLRLEARKPYTNHGEKSVHLNARVPRFGSDRFRSLLAILQTHPEGDRAEALFSSIITYH